MAKKDIKVLCRNNSINSERNKVYISRTFIGQLGDNTTTNRYTPTQIGTSDWSSIAAGGSHSLGISIEIIPSSNFFLFFN